LLYKEVETVNKPKLDLFLSTFIVKGVHILRTNILKAHVAYISIFTARCTIAQSAGGIAIASRLSVLSTAKVKKTCPYLHDQYCAIF